MRRTVAKGVKRSEARKQSGRRVAQPPQSAPAQRRRQVADGPSPQPGASPPQAKPQQKLPQKPGRTNAQARKDANSVRVVAESLRDQTFLAALQRGAPDLVRLYMGTKMKSRGCGGCGMKSLFRMVHEQISSRRDMPALAEAMSYLIERGWTT